MIPLRELLAGLEVEYRGVDPMAAIRDVGGDSRAVGPGMAFIALAGERRDGHEFLAAAAAAGAAVAIVQRGRPLPPGLPAAIVPDTSAALPVVAANLHGWPGRELSLVGITGTNGKTTTAHLVGAIFAAAGRRHCRLGTTGNFIVDHEEVAAFTTPFPLELQALLARARTAGATHAVMEVSSHAIAQARIDPLAFRAVALTSFSQDHLDFHADMASYLAAKLELAARYLQAGGTAVAPMHDEAGRRFLAAAPPDSTRWGISLAPDVEVPIQAVEWSTSAAGTSARVRTPVGELALVTPLVGAYNLSNALVALALTLAVGIEPDAILRGLATSRGAPGRLERVGVTGPAVYVDYAHTPDAVARALEALRPTCRGRLIVVLGCGGDRDPSKRPLMGRAASEGADLFYATSDNPRTEDPEAIVDQMLAGVPASRTVVREVDRRRAIAHAISRADPDDTILVAGKGHEDYQVLGTEKIHFDDREEAARALRARG
jgi:UDP-N-acetylmuramoyl-L-alanyl-D-glutamate--2,6-diaminopimelate ligase